MLDLDAELEEYIGLHSEPEPEILQQLSRATHQKILRPRMLSGNLQAIPEDAVPDEPGPTGVGNRDIYRLCSHLDGNGHGRERRAPYHRHQ